MSDDDLTSRVRERAYFLWIEEGRPEGKAEEHWRRARAAEAMDLMVDEASDESFPASDPPAASGISGPVGPA